MTGLVHRFFFTFFLLITVAWIALHGGRTAWIDSGACCTAEISRLEGVIVGTYARCEWMQWWSVCAP